MAQRITRPSMVIQFVNMLLHPLYCQVLVFWMSLGLHGAAAVRFVATIFHIAGLVVYMKVSGCCKKTLVAPSMDIFKGWKEFILVALPSLLMVGFEWCASEIMNLMAGRLGVEDLAASVISINYNGCISMFCMGIAIVTGTLVGNSIGENNIKKAKTYAKAGLFINNITVLTLCLLILLFRSFLARVFTQNAEVIRILKNLLYLLLLHEIFQTNQTNISKVLIAMGKQAHASFVSLVSYYLVMLPVGLVAAFWLEWRVYGIWAGMVVANACVCVGYGHTAYATDWNKLRKEIKS
eukprot:TRINITY_DN1471_c0_g3_i5.p1 TRINITY_DN1471_c0_g3~~TRINITY_DN1471_c0_g3_i5.p1  ORF type:complete len:342 (+),score=63.08 TRINITY_DN1471_c0_g3_i5:147-1028(+)